MRLFGLNRVKLACPSLAEEADGIIRNVVELGVVGVGVTGDDSSGTPTEVRTERPESTAGELALLHQLKINDSSVAAQDCQPPWQNGLLWVDTE
jgi:hypothetical protein